MIFDVSACAGHWPFRKLYKPQLSDLLAAHQKNGVTHAVVSCLDSVFYNDPTEGDEELAAALPANYGFIMTHNPKIPYAQDDLTANASLAVGVRLYPNYHKYALNDATVTAFCKQAAAQGLPIFITCKSDDYRIGYLVAQTVPALDDIIGLAKAVPTATFILTGYSAGDLYRDAALMQAVGNLYADTAFFNNLYLPFDQICAVFPFERILYGSLFPLQCMETALLALDYADIDANMKEHILYRNAERIFG